MITLDYQSRRNRKFLIISYIMAVIMFIFFGLISILIIKAINITGEYDYLVYFVLGFVSFPVAGFIKDISDVIVYRYRLSWIFHPIKYLKLKGKRIKGWFVSSHSWLSSGWSETIRHLNSTCTTEEVERYKARVLDAKKQQGDIWVKRHFVTLCDRRLRMIEEIDRLSLD